MYPAQHILITVDVEDWFQVENFKTWIPFSTWDERKFRVEKNVHRLLNLFDSIDTSRKSPHDICEPGKEARIRSDRYMVNARSIVVLVRFRDRRR